MYDLVHRTERKARVYIAGPLFTTAEMNFNAKLKRHLSKYFEVYLPQEDGGLMADMIAHGIWPELAARTVFSEDIRALQQCDLLLLLMLDGTIDEGAAFELGFAYSIGKACYGLRTNLRSFVQDSNNPMIGCSLRHIFQDVSELLDWARRYTRDNLVGVGTYAERHVT